jgi:signal transduction histidine kinase
VTDSTRSNVRHALRVAGTATAIVALVYLVVVVVFDVEVAHHLLAQVDGRLAAQLADTARHPDTIPVSPSGQAAALEPATPGDLDDAPLFVWVVGAGGTVTSSSIGAPVLPVGSFSRQAVPVTAPVGPSSFRLDSRRYDGGWLVAGVSLANQDHVQQTLVFGEVVAGPIALFGMFLGSLVIGIKASAPVERARLRQLEFTADASHELRTPLSVIEAEVDLALRSQRDAPSYRASLERVREESGRLLRIVEDLLWLARFDSNPPPPAREPIDLGTIAEVCVARFRPLAESRRIELRSELRGEDTPWVSAPADWIDRLAAVLVDNACRYSPDGGLVRVLVETHNGRVSLVVEDSGPGIPPEERPRLFDRFHRASDVPGGTGLGLAIADSIVRSTEGRWRIGDSSLGGARMEVSWHHPNERGRDSTPIVPTAGKPIGIDHALDGHGQSPSALSTTVSPTGGEGPVSRWRDGWAWSRSAG